jgi:hypothetical protein
LKVLCRLHTTEIDLGSRAQDFTDIIADFDAMLEDQRPSAGPFGEPGLLALRPGSKLISFCVTLRQQDQRMQKPELVQTPRPQGVA